MNTIYTIYNITSTTNTIYIKNMQVPGNECSLYIYENRAEREGPVISYHPHPILT